MCLLLIAGLSLHFLWPLAFGFLLLVLLLSGFALLSLAKRAREIVKKREKRDTIPPLIPAVPIVPTAKRASWTKSALMLAIGLGIGAISGYAIRNQQLNVKRYSYTDVLVVARHDATHYTLQPQWMKPWEMTTCTEQNWQSGEKMQFLNFQYHAACDDVENGSFVFYSQPDGKRTNYQEVLNVRN